MLTQKKLRDEKAGRWNTKVTNYFRLIIKILSYVIPRCGTNNKAIFTLQLRLTAFLQEISIYEIDSEVRKAVRLLSIKF